MLFSGNHGTSRVGLTIALMVLAIAAWSNATYADDSGARGGDVPQLDPRPYRIGITASPFAPQPPNALFEPDGLAGWKKLRQRIDHYKYYGARAQQPAENGGLNVGRFVEATEEAGITIGIEFGHFFVPPPDSGRALWSDALEAAVRQIEPIHEAGGRVSSMHVDGAIRRALGFGGGGGIERRSLPFEEAIKQVARFWGELGERYPEMEIGLITNFPNWDYTGDLHGYVGHFTDKTDITYHQAVTALHEKVEATGGDLAFIEVDCPYSYYEKQRTHNGDAPLDNPRKLRQLQHWCRQHDIGYHLIVNQSAASHKQELNEQQRRAHSQRFRDGTVAFLRRLHRDGIFPDLFHIQSWYAVPDRQLPETEPLTFTATALEAAQLIEQRFPRKAAE